MSVFRTRSGKIGNEIACNGIQFISLNNRWLSLEKILAYSIQLKEVAEMLCKFSHLAQPKISIGL